MKPSHKNIIIPVLLLAVYALSIGLRARLFTPYDRGDEFSPIYNTESAVHLRYAAMVSRGEKVPRVDVPAEYPDGFAVFERSEIFEEFVAGYLHRLPGLNRLPVHRFVEFFSWCFSALSVFAVFFLACLLTSDPWLSLLSALGYAVAAPAVVRTVNGFFIREVFTLPLIFLHLCLVVRALQKEGWHYPALSAAVMLPVIASWQVWRFTWLILFLYLAVKYFMSGNTPELRKSIAGIVSAHALVFILASFLVPYLRHQGGLSEIPVGLTAGFALFLQLRERAGKLPLWVSALAGAAIAAGMLFLAPGTREHNYIFSMVLLKIRYLFAKPADPASIPLIIRVLWTGPFESPSSYDLVYLVLTYWIWGAFSMVFLLQGLKSGRTGPAGELFLYLLTAYSAGMVFFTRLSVFLVFFLAAGIAVSLKKLGERVPGKKALFITAALLLLFMEGVKTWQINSVRPFLAGFFQAAGVRSPKKEFQARLDTVLDIVRYVRDSVPEDSGVLARYSLSGLLLYYTGRPVFLSPHYGRPTMERIRLFSGALFGPERELAGLCREKGADYIIHPADVYMLDNKRSERYMIGRLEHSGDEAVYLMQYHPERLRHFTLVHQNDYMRVYKRTGAPGPGPDGTVGEHFPLYDESLPGRLERTPNDLFLDFQEADRLVYMAENFHRAERFPEALAFYARALDIFPLHVKALVNSGRIHLGARRMKEAVRFFEAAYNEARTADTMYGMSIVHMTAGRREQALGLLIRIVEDDPCYIPALADMAALAAAAGDFPRALLLAERIVSCDGDPRLAERMLTDIYTRMGRPDKTAETRERFRGAGTGR